jgi:hypothetical protein
VDQAGLATFEAGRPSLIVIDYAEQRSTWLSDVLVRLSGGRHEFPVRILVLERSASGEWWSVTQRVNRMEESHQVAAAMYEPFAVHSNCRDASRVTAMWSAAVLEPALPGRSRIASGSPVPCAPWSANAHNG